MSAAQAPGPSTRAVAAVGLPSTPGQPMLPGPVMAAPYLLSADEGSEPDVYARSSHPGWRALEAALAELEGAAGALVVGSGLSAITVALRVLTEPGRTLVVPSDGYYQVRRYAAEQVARGGVTVRECPTARMTELVGDLDAVALVLAETPSNPGLDVVDLRRLADATHAAGGLLAVDNTTPTPLGQRPLALGADLVVASGTKALSGHSDLLMGYLAADDPGLLSRLETERLLSGTVLGPMETWLAHRSLGSAGLRLERQCANALAVARLLRGHPGVRDVRYPGLEDDPAHPVAAAQMERFGGLVGFTLPSEEAFHAFVRASRLVTNATSFGGLHTTADRRARWGDEVPPGFTRLSCGIEDTDDLLADLTAALGSAATRSV